MNKCKGCDGEFESLIEDIIADMRKPRSICICPNPVKAGTSDVYYFYKCANCNQDLSAQRCFEGGLWD